MTKIKTSAEAVQTLEELLGDTPAQAEAVPQDDPKNDPLLEQAKAISSQVSKQAFRLSQATHDERSAGLAITKTYRPKVEKLAEIASTAASAGSDGPDGDTRIYRSKMLDHLNRTSVAELKAFDDIEASQQKAADAVAGLLAWPKGLEAAIKSYIDDMRRAGKLQSENVRKRGKVMADEASLAEARSTLDKATGAWKSAVLEGRDDQAEVAAKRSAEEDVARCQFRLEKSTEDASNLTEPEAITAPARQALELAIGQVKKLQRFELELAAVAAMNELRENFEPGSTALVGDGVSQERFDSYFSLVRADVARFTSSRAKRNAASVVSRLEQVPAEIERISHAKHYLATVVQQSNRQLQSTGNFVFRG